MTDFNKLIPELADWNNGAGIDIESWIGCMGNSGLAIGYSTIFWPRFVEFERYVLREGFSEESLRGFEQQCQGNRQAIEAVMNHLHLGDLHYGCKGITRERVVYLGHVLKEIYQAKLAWQFPGKRFEVFFDDSESDELSIYQITFYQTKLAADRRA